MNLYNYNKASIYGTNIRITPMLYLKANFIRLRLPHFNYYTSNFKYRFIATIPMMCKLFYKNNPFDRILHNDKKILCYESKSRSLRKNLNLIIKPHPKKRECINDLEPLTNFLKKKFALIRMFRKDYVSSFKIILIQITLTTFFGNTLNDVS